MLLDEGAAGLLVPNVGRLQDVTLHVEGVRADHGVADLAVHGGLERTFSPLTYISVNPNHLWALTLIGRWRFDLKQ